MLSCPFATVKQLTTVNDQPVKEPTTANDQSMMEQLKKVRANRKYVLTVAYKTTKRTTLDLNRDAVLAHRQFLMTAFKLFEKALNEYLEVLEREEDVQCAEDYYDIEEKVYIKNLKMLNSAMEELSCYSVINDRSSNCVSVMSLLLNMSTAVMLPACEPELSHLQQNEPSESAPDEHVPFPDIHPDSSVKLPCSEIHTCSEPTDPATSSNHGTSHFISSKVIEQKLDNKYSVIHNHTVPLSEHIPESEVTNLLQKEQSMCMGREHIPSSEVILDSSGSSSHPDICYEPCGYNYHHQQTVNVPQCSIEMQADHIVMPLHDIHIGDYETLFTQMQPCSISAHPLNTVQIMCLTYSANNPPNIDDVNVSEMLACQNLPGG